MRQVWGVQIPRQGPQPTMTIADRPGSLPEALTDSIINPIDLYMSEARTSSSSAGRLQSFKLSIVKAEISSTFVRLGVAAGTPNISRLLPCPSITNLCCAFIPSLAKETRRVDQTTFENGYERPVEPKSAAFSMHDHRAGQPLQPRKPLMLSWIPVDRSRCHS